MNQTNKDPILTSLARIEAKQDSLLQNQEAMDAEIKQISKDTKRTASVVGGASGAVAGGIVSVGFQFIKAKMGF